MVVRVMVVHDVALIVFVVVASCHKTHLAIPTFPSFLSAFRIAAAVSPNRLGLLLLLRIEGGKTLSRRRRVEAR